MFTINQYGTFQCPASIYVSTLELPGIHMRAARLGRRLRADCATPAVISQSDVRIRAGTGDYADRPVSFRLCSSVQRVHLGGGAGGQEGVDRRGAGSQRHRYGGGCVAQSDKQRRAEDAVVPLAELRDVQFAAAASDSAQVAGKIMGHVTPGDRLGRVGRCLFSPRRPGTSESRR